MTGHESRRLAGLLLVVFPSVIIGGVSMPSLRIGDPAYMANKLRQDRWRAGHAHAGVTLLLALVMLRYVDEARLSAGWRWVARLSAPVAAILLSVAFFFSVLMQTATRPNTLIYLAYVAAAMPALDLLVLGLGLLRQPPGP